MMRFITSRVGRYTAFGDGTVFYNVSYGINNHYDT